MLGWVCPKCGVSVSPNERTCPRCNDKFIQPSPYPYTPWRYPTTGDPMPPPAQTWCLVGPNIWGHSVVQVTSYTPEELRKVPVFVGYRS